MFHTSNIVNIQIQFMNLYIYFFFDLHFFTFIKLTIGISSSSKDIVFRVPCPSIICVSSCTILLVRRWEGLADIYSRMWTGTTKMIISICWNIIEITNSLFWLTLHYFSLLVSVVGTVGALISCPLGCSRISPSWATCSSILRR